MSIATEVKVRQILEIDLPKQEERIYELAKRADALALRVEVLEKLIANSSRSSRKGRDSDEE